MVFLAAFPVGTGVIGDQHGVGSLDVKRSLAPWPVGARRVVPHPHNAAIPP